MEGLPAVPALPLLFTISPDYFATFIFIPKTILLCIVVR
jgi:hypothetical protein